MLSIAIWIT